MGLLALNGRLAGAGTGDLIARYRLPRPRLALGRALRGSAHAAIDVSDGLVADLMHVCESSSVAAAVRGDAVPLSDAGRAALAVAPELLPTVLAGGDDYELLFTVPAGFDPAASFGEVPIAEIGEIVEGRGVTVLGADGAPLVLRSPRLHPSLAGTSRRRHALRRVTPPCVPAGGVACARRDGVSNRWIAVVVHEVPWIPPFP